MTEPTLPVPAIDVRALAERMRFVRWVAESIARSLEHIVILDPAAEAAHWRAIVTRLDPQVGPAGETDEEEQR